MKYDYNNYEDRTELLIKELATRVYRNPYFTEAIGWSFQAQYINIKHVHKCCCTITLTI
jgi:hypothetical protein